MSPKMFVLDCLLWLADYEVHFHFKNEVLLNAHLYKIAKQILKSGRF